MTGVKQLGLADLVDLFSDDPELFDLIDFLSERARRSVLRFGAKRVEESLKVVSYPAYLEGNLQTKLIYELQSHPLGGLFGRDWRILVACRMADVATRAATR